MNPCILVFGMPRSGTTWVGKLFDSHPDTLYRHEPDSIRKLSLPQFPETENAREHQDELERFVASMAQMRSTKVVGKQPLFPKSYQSAAAFAVYRASVFATKAASRVGRDVPCLYRPTGASCGQVRLVWKSIESLGRLGVCIEALPDARAIHLMRHPCGYIASVLRGRATQRFSGPKPSTKDPWLLRLLLKTPTAKPYQLSLDGIKKLTLEEQLAWRWVLIQEKVLADAAHDERVLTVRYEDVCAEPLAMTRRMFQFTGLEWQAQTEQFLAASTEGAQTDYYSVFKSPQAAAGRWRSELEPEVMERVLRILRRSSLSRFYPDHAHETAARSEAEA